MYAKAITVKIPTSGQQLRLVLQVWFNSTPREVLEKAGLFGYALLSPERKRLDLDDPRFYWLIRDGEELVAFQKEVIDSD